MGVLVPARGRSQEKSRFSESGFPTLGGRVEQMGQDVAEPGQPRNLIFSVASAAAGS